MPALSAVQSSCAVACPDPLDQAIQQELAALAAAAATHRSACRWLDEWSGPEGVKEHVAHRIEARHRREREPHLLRLADLHQQRIAVTKSPRWPTRAAACAMVRSQGGANQRTPRIPENNQDTSPRRNRPWAAKGRGLCP